MPDTARIDPTLTDDLVAFLGELAVFHDQHRIGGPTACPCDDQAAHDRRHDALMARKADLLARCRADLERP